MGFTEETMQPNVTREQATWMTHQNNLFYDKDNKSKGKLKHIGDIIKAT